MEKEKMEQCKARLVEAANWGRKLGQKTDHPSAAEKGSRLSPGSGHCSRGREIRHAQGQGRGQDPGSPG